MHWGTATLPGVHLTQKKTIQLYKPIILYKNTIQQKRGKKKESMQENSNICWKHTGNINIKAHTFRQDCKRIIKKMKVCDCNQDDQHQEKESSTVEPNNKTCPGCLYVRSSHV